MRIAAIATCLWMLGAALLPARGEIPSQNPTIPAVKVEAAPQIDGLLDEACWQTLPPLTGFYHELKPAAEETRVRLCYGPEALYVAFECEDREPQNIRGQQTKRNGNMEKDDTVGLGLNPLGDLRTYYWFWVNPRGTQSEEIPGGSASKVEWRGDWQAAAKVHERGWNAEMAIPFSLLKYPRGQKRFGVIFLRHLARLQESSNWPPLTGYYAHDHQAYWGDLELPRFRPRPIAMPYLLWGSGKGLKSQIGVDGKYVAEDNLTALWTFNPDFQTIEDVVQTIDFSYNPRYLEDRRPFFTEGGSFFQDNMMFYSRTVGEVDVGLKAYGKRNGLSFGALEARESSGKNVALFNVGYDVTPLGQIRCALVDYRGKGQSNTVYKLGTEWRKPAQINNFYYGLNVRGSRLNGSSSKPAWSAYMDYWTGWERLGWHLHYTDIPADYQATLAYVPEKGLRGVNGWLEYGKEYRQGRILSWTASLGFDQTRHRGGGLFHESLTPSYNLEFRNQVQVRVGYEYQNRPPYRDRITELHYHWNRNDLYRTGNITYRWGRQAGGPYRFLRVQQGYPFTPRFSVQLNFESLRLDPSEGSPEHFDQTFLSGLYEFSPERSIATRIIDRSGKTNLYLAYRQELRKGADIFVVLGDPNAEETVSRIGVKVVNTY
jgi:hypothetical protein